MVLQRSKLSVRRTVMMLTIRSRNRDNGARRGRVDCTHVVALGARFHEKSLYGRWYYRYAKGFSFFLFFLAVREEENGSRRGNSFLFIDTHFCVKDT